MDIFIDLDTAPPLPVHRPPRSRLPRPNPRLLLVVGLLLALVVPASAAAAVPPVTPLFTVPLTREPAYLISGGALYLGTGNDLLAYQLATGRLLWRTHLGQPIQRLNTVTPGGVLLALLDTGPSLSLAAVDAVSGRALWQRGNFFGQPVPGGSKLLAIQYGGPTQAAHDVLLLDGRSGSASWQRSVPEDGTFLADLATPSSGRAVLARSGPSSLDVEVLQVATGDTVVHGDLAQRVPALGAALIDSTVSLVGNLLVVAAVAPDGTTAYGFDAGTLAPLWRTGLPSAALYASDCAAVLCLYGEGGTVSLDRATGGLLGVADWDSVVALAPGRLLAQRDSAAIVGTNLVSVLDLTDWRLVTIGPRPLLIRPGSNPTDVFVAVLDPGAVDGARPAVHTLGTTHVGPIGSCRGDTGYLVCYALDRGLVAFTLP